MKNENIEWTQQRLEAMIANCAEESVYMDFKAAAALTNDKKKDICKDVSAFANSDGGVIIYGMNEVDHKAHSFSFIDGYTVTKEWLEQVIKDGIHRRIDGIRIHPIRFENDIKQTVYVVEVPLSPLAPHMTKDNRYYKRFNFMSVAMEEYEVRHTFERKQNAKLDICDTLIMVTNGDSWFQDKYFNFHLTFHIVNDGHAVADYYKLKCLIKGAKGFGVYWDRDKGYNSTRLTGGGYAFSTTSSFPIFPEEQVSILDFDFRVDLGNEVALLKDIIMELILYTPNSTITTEFDIKGALGKMIKKTLGQTDESED